MTMIISDVDRVISCEHFLELSTAEIIDLINTIVGQIWGKDL